MEKILDCPICAEEERRKVKDGKDGVDIFGIYKIDGMILHKEILLPGDAYRRKTGVAHVLVKRRPPELIQEGEKWKVKCPHCGLETVPTRHTKTEDDAISSWNGMNRLRFGKKEDVEIDERDVMIDLDGYFPCCVWKRHYVTVR